MYVERHKRIDDKSFVNVKPANSIAVLLAVKGIEKYVCQIFKERLQIKIKYLSQIRPC